MTPANLVGRSSSLVRHVVKPGMAGWELVKQGYGATKGDALLKLQYDLYYIKHQSLYLDLLIILKTIGRALLFRRAETAREPAA